MYDFLLIGQGLAGSLLAHFLRADGCSVAIIDNAQPRAATRVAAGLINPVTGRRFVKSWRIDELLPFARQTYRQLEADLGISIYHERPIFRAIYSVEEENLWLERCADPAYEQYVSDKADMGAYQPWVAPPRAFGAVLGGAQVEVGALVEALQDKWLSEGVLLSGSVDLPRLDISRAGVRYGNLHARTAVCCDGRWGKENPFFRHLPLTGDKGEILLVRFPDEVQFDAILKHRVFVVPLTDGTYWIGSNYSSRYDSDAPTAQGRQWLEGNLRRTLACPFEVLDHKAAIRPTVRDRRPLLGGHPEHENLFVFNGLGTKGASLGPFWARHMASFLQGKVVLDVAVDVGRFGE